ncbi:DUF3788 domain-containing protein [Scatolibacter rhodanostii]|uniref:DUF3788 domain-containing protein n=1 Tax=Scatolibacter rhodanostii TaxID=2014781 RepID=UPI000C06BA18|nr:DUF3788 domain-containing protein [Scatolibacter rhodanostii]
MLLSPPTIEEMCDLIGQHLYETWTNLTELIEANYDMDHLWNSGGKRWTYEYKYRRGGKTLCALYAKENMFGLMIIFGKAEREKVEAIRGELLPQTQQIYDEATTFHDGKWVMFELTDASLFSDLKKLLSIKRKPNRKYFGNSKKAFPAEM